MCTVVIDVPRNAGEPVRLLAVRDEDRDRPWRGLGPWWPEHDGVVGVRDDRAGGAWLAVDPRTARLAVLLNREDLSGRGDDEVVSRGGIPLDAVGNGIPDHPATRGFNLVEVDADGAHLVEWDGLVARRTRLTPGTHMIAHHAVDDPVTPRVVRWLEAFRSAGIASGPEWWMPWLGVVEDSTSDPSASVLRRDEHDEHVLESLLVCTASIGPDGVEVREAAVAEPGRWDDGIVAALRSAPAVARAAVARSAIGASKTHLVAPPDAVAGPGPVAPPQPTRPDPAVAGPGPVASPRPAHSGAIAPPEPTRTVARPEPTRAAAPSESTPVDPAASPQPTRADTAQ